jgi:hypothetical protein
VSRGEAIKQVLEKLPAKARQLELKLYYQIANVIELGEPSTG